MPEKPLSFTGGSGSQVSRQSSNKGGKVSALHNGRLETQEV